MATLELLGRASEAGTQADRSGGSGKTAGHARMRADIEGLRAIATFLVLPFHAGLMLFPGGFVGVDVFFVISGFVITGQLVREVERSGRVRLLDFYARRVRRLLPASAVVLGATTFMVWAWVPRIRWETTGGDIVAAALYVVNWRLADRSVDYLAEDVTPSPVQHFWSLSVEEQFYLLWPLLVLAAALVAARYGVRRKVALAVGLTAVALPSLLWAGHQAVASPERAYFATSVRIWEFAVGAFVALVAVRLARLPRGLAIGLAWVGLAMILWSGRTYSTDMTWPGYAALVPTLGAGLLIGAGVAAGRHGPVWLLGRKPMLVVGYLTYSLYLWHWPLLIVAREHFGGIPVWVGLLIVVFSAVPAWLTYTYVETPFRSSPVVTKHRRVAFGLGANATLVGVAAGLTLIVALSHSFGPGSAVGTAAITPVGGTTGALGAAALGNDPAQSSAGEVGTSWPATIVPDPVLAPKDVPGLYRAGCQQQPDSAEPVSCSYGNKDAGTTIAVVGDSKAAQWVPAFEQLVKKHDWHVITYNKSACQFVDTDTPLDGGVYTTCREWTHNVLAKLTGPDQPDVVVTAGQQDDAVTGVASDGTLVESQPVLQAALAKTWQQVEDAGVKVVVLAVTPQTGRDIYPCVADRPKDPGECAYERANGVAASGAPTQRAAAEAAKVPFIDLVDWICPRAECAPVIGGVLVYRQGSHITKTYIESLAPRLEQELARLGIR
jgi:peptidoglycan/LPS O-acetylase OafA/YrhL